MATVTRGGVRIYYTVSGDGPAVLFHTGGGGDGDMWERAGYIDALPGRRHIVMDHRGHGRSDKPDGLATHRMDEYAADVIAVLDAAGVERAATVGYSDGAYLLYMVAARHPDRVAAVVGLGGVHHPDETNDGRLELARRIRQVGVPAWIEEGFDEAEPAPAWLIDNLAATPDEMLALELEAWVPAPTAVAYFPKITAPTLIVCGEHENADGAAELAVAALPDGGMRMLPGFGHLQTFWRSDVTAPLVAEFLARHAPAGTTEPLAKGRG